MLFFEVDRDPTLIAVHHHECCLQPPTRSGRDPAASYQLSRSLLLGLHHGCNSSETVGRENQSLDGKEGVKLAINKENIQLSVNSANSGEGNEIIKANFNSGDLNISFNSKYLIDIASEVEDKNLKMNLKDSVSPVLIEDASDKNSYYVIMPMKI